MAMSVSASYPQTPILGRTLAGEADAFHVAIVGTAAAAKHVELRKAAEEIGILFPQLHRIAHIQLG